MTDARARARKIKLFLFDVDGVLTDGKLFFFPKPPGAELSTQTHAAKHGGQGGFGLASTTMVEAKGFHAHDRTAISLARLAGIKTGLITKRISETVALRARDLKLEHVHQGIQDKLTVFEQIVQQEGITPAQATFAGANARAEVKRDAHYVTPHAGGDGALRDAVEFILKAQGKWNRVVSEYICE